MPTAKLPIDAAHRAASSDAHAIEAVTGLTDALAGKAAVAHETALTGVHGIVVKNTSSLGLGVDALRDTTTGAHNLAIGWRPLIQVTSGVGNVAVGSEAVFSCKAGSYNMGVGYRALRSIVDSSSNVGIGGSAGRNLADGVSENTASSHGTYIGSGTRASVAGATNEIVIGNNAIGGGSNTVRLGNASVTNWLPGATNKVALGSSTLAFKEQYMTDGTNNWKLTVDATGPVWTSF